MDKAVKWAAIRVDEQRLALRDLHFRQVGNKRFPVLQIRPNLLAFRYRVELQILSPPRGSSIQP